MQEQEMGMTQEAVVTCDNGIKPRLGMVDYFDVTCFDAEGKFKWFERIHNLVTNQGLSHVIQTIFTGEDAAITSWFVGLKAAGAPLAADTASALPSVGNWVEYVDYSQTTRPALTLSNEASQATNNSSNVASFTIASPAGDVVGVFVVDDTSKNSNTGATVLYGVGDFTTAKVVDPLDTLNVTVTLSAASV